MQPSGGADKNGPGYAPQGALATRASASEAEPSDDAATALDRPRFTDEEITSWGASDASRSPAPAAPGPVPRRAGRRTALVVAWVAIGVLGGAAGVAGGLFGVWLATRWG